VTFSLLAALVGVQPAYAAGFNVSTAAELIAAINTANTNGVDDVINFTGDITLTAVDNSYGSTGPNGLPVILNDGSLTIEGNGHTLSRDGAAPAFRFFMVLDDVSFAVNDLTLSNGLVGSTCGSSGTGECDGGAMYFGTVGPNDNISNTAFLGNKADGSGGAIATGRNLIIKDSVFSGNGANNDNDTSGVGGAIVAGGSAMTVTNSTFADNHAQSGGAIYAFTVNLSNVAISGNTAGQSAGGVFISESGSIDKSLISGNTAGSVGGGIMYKGCCSELLVTNTTISGNSTRSYGGALFASLTDNIRFFNSTLSGNSAGSGGGGIFSDGSRLYLYNTIIANSTGGDCQLDSAGITSSNSLIEDSGANACGLTNGSNGTIIGSDPNLAPLADNGGPTQTHALLSTSPAIDAGDDTVCPVTDQRGVTRPQGAHCDIGAYEIAATQSGPNSVVNTNADSDDGFCDLPGQGIGNQDCTLREAINAAGVDGAASVITFAGDYTITLGSQLPNILTTITITGNGAANTIIQAAASPNTANYRVFAVVHSGTISGNLTLNGVTVQNGRSHLGGGIYSETTLTINDSIIRNNYTFDFGIGGGVYNTGTSLTVRNSTFENNIVTEGNGGAIGNGFGSVTVLNSTFTNNYALDGGGGIFADGTLNVFNSTFSGNDTDYLGDGIYINNGRLNYANTIIANSPGNHCYLKSSTVGTNLNNLVEDGSCSAALTGDPNLGPLQDNGGPTPTMALLSGSPAIDSGDDTVCAASPVNNLDQRGVTRPQSAHCDIGAYEAEITNTAPAADPGGPYLGAVNTAIQFDGNASSDPEGDTLSYAWDFGDGNSGTGAAPTHNYASTGIYDVCLTVNDGTVDSTQVCTLAVVYDPSAGFVSGSGWIDSPAGAYMADPSLTGKATFGFVSKYKKGASVPTGTTAFTFDLAGFDFYSETYEWLVVNGGGTNAQFKGSGTVNDGLDPNGNPFKFMLWAGDGSPDTFHIRIWWEDTDGTEYVVYDNGTDQPIGAGKIVVHKGK